MKAYSMDLRVRVLADATPGWPTPAVAPKYRVSAAWVRRLKQRRRETGEIAPRPGGRGPRPSWPPTPTGSARRSADTRTPPSPS